MALFLSTYRNKVDKKGRISVPALFRQALVGQSFHGIVAYPSFTNPSIEASGIDRIERLSQSIDTLDPYSEERDAFAVTILGSSVQLGFDSEGRILLPENLLSLAGISEQAVIVGKGVTFEIWEPERFDSYQDNARIMAKEKRNLLSLSSPSKEKE